ncbi:hypothetical protein NYY93_24730, partial [Acinetobacter baumannii]|nr:hypothetical protein [Acinetobacter baumannii]
NCCPTAVYINKNNTATTSTITLLNLEEASVNTNTIIIFSPILGDAPKNFIKSKTTLLQFFP